ncbi:MAG: hypothetical protein KME47_09845 [Nodosilinea sp. WJT8-NPBG4]|jgi:hypothetical protein|nr:hypothetical protein [Nodosilinea sp. WJT8-NPBG4]
MITTIHPGFTYQIVENGHTLTGEVLEINRTAQNTFTYRVLWSDNTESIETSISPRTTKCTNLN